MRIYIIILLSSVISLNICGQGVTKNGQNTTTGSGFVNKSGKIVAQPALTRNGQELLLPTISTTVVSAISSTSAMSGGNVLSDGGSTVISRGVCWSTSTNPTIADSKTSDGNGSGTFSSSITGLSLNTKYYLRSYAINSLGIAYGNEVSFTTILSVGDSYQGGVVAYILQPGDPGYLAGETQGLIAAPSDVSTGIQWYNGSYILTDATAYSFGSGYANTNTIVISQGDGSYAAKLCFDLELGGYSDWYLPSRDELSKLYNNRSLIGGFTNDLYWSSSDGTLVNAHIVEFSTGVYTTIPKHSICRIRAVRTFSTVQSVLPTLSTNAVTSITQSAAISGGNIESDGGASITARGVCWSSSPNPTIAGNKTLDGTGVGPFSSSITGLIVGTTYYLRAYATNSVGTAYGVQVTFKAVYAIGDTYQGGIIFNITGTYPNQHGLICASTDQGSNIGWGCYRTPIPGAGGTAAGTGNLNTSAIVSVCLDAGIAARVCNDLILNGYSDWFLPSLGELNLMYNNLKVNGLGGFAASTYWSSSQYNEDYAYAKSFSTGAQSYPTKVSGYRVRAVRTF